MSQSTQPATPRIIDDLQGLEIETFKIEELDGLDVNAAEVKISLCSSTTSSSCG
jgi:thiazolylpeptide-type bacteriocin precursor